MIKDITIGQYFPGNSVIHRLDSRVKLVLDILYLVILFTAQSYTGLLLGMLFMVMCYMLARIKLIMILKSVKPPGRGTEVQAPGEPGNSPRCARECGAPG